MPIRFKKYRHKAGGDRTFGAIRITEANMAELVATINKRGGSAFVTSGAKGKPKRIRIKQRNYGHNWGKVDWRVALVGDFIVRHDFKAGELNREKAATEFERVREDDFEASAELLKK